MLVAVPATKPVPTTTFGFTVAATPVSVVCRLMAAAKAMPLATLVDEVAVASDAVSSEENEAPMA